MKEVEEDRVVFFLIGQRKENVVSLPLPPTKQDLSFTSLYLSPFLFLSFFLSLRLSFVCASPNLD